MCCVQKWLLPVYLHQQLMRSVSFLCPCHHFLKHNFVNLMCEEWYLVSYICISLVIMRFQVLLICLLLFNFFCKLLFLSFVSTPIFVLDDLSFFLLIRRNSSGTAIICYLNCKYLSVYACPFSFICTIVVPQIFISVQIHLLTFSS